MGLVKDEIGNKHGRLAVLSRAENSKNGKAHWLCRCSCGKETVVAGVRLRNGTSKSCGCLGRERVSEKLKVDLTGQKFSRLLALKEVGKNKCGFIRWECRCDCGKIHIVSSGNLKNGAVKSCGCLRKRIGGNHPNFKSGITDEERQNGRKYPEYNEWRKAVFERDDYTCQKCGDDKGGNLNAHHLEPYMANPDVRIALSNGVTLCKTCHINFHHQFGFDTGRNQFESYIKEL